MLEIGQAPGYLREIGHAMLLVFFWLYKSSYDIKLYEYVSTSTMCIGFRANDVTIELNCRLSSTIRLIDMVNRKCLIYDVSIL